MTRRERAVLALADGRIFEGEPLGARGEAVGEVVFNTAMCGYQEVLTDPSYKGQIVCMTYPHIGNTGVNEEDPESHRPWAEGFVVRGRVMGPLIGIHSGDRVRLSTVKDPVRGEPVFQLVDEPYRAWR